MKNKIPFGIWGTAPRCWRVFYFFIFIFRPPALSPLADILCTPLIIMWPYHSVVLLEWLYMMKAELSSMCVSFLACFGMFLTSQVKFTWFNFMTKSCCCNSSIFLVVYMRIFRTVFKVINLCCLNQVPTLTWWSSLTCSCLDSNGSVLSTCFHHLHVNKRPKWWANLQFCLENCVTTLVWGKWHVITCTCTYMMSNTMVRGFHYLTLHHFILYKAV